MNDKYDSDDNGLKIKRLVLPHIDDAETKSLSVRRLRLNSVHSTDGSIFSEHQEKENKTPGGKSTASRTGTAVKDKTKKKKKLDDIEEVYEELNGFLAHTKLALISFLTLLFHVIKVILGLVFKLIFPVLEKLLWIIFILFIFICAMFAFLGNLLEKFRDKNKRLNPFFNKKQMQRIDKFDKIWERKKFTLVLDLDGTLIHASRQRKTSYQKGIQYDRLSINVLGQGRQTVHLYTRPFLEEFLSRMGETFNLVIFSASDECYCDAIVDHVDKWRVVQQRFYRSSADFEQKKVKKDLTKVIKHHLDNVLMIEDAPGVCVQKEKTIIVKKWMGEDANDAELKSLMDILIEAAEIADDGFHLIELYKKKLLESKKKDVSLNEPHDEMQGEMSLVVETDGGVTSPNYEETGREDTEMSRDDFSRHDFPTILVSEPISKKER